MDKRSLKIIEKDMSKLKIYRDWEERHYVSGRIRRFAKVWARMLLKNEVDYKKACNVYKRNEQIPEATVKRLLKRKEVQNMINKEIEALLEKEGITPEFVLQKQREVLDGAMEKKDFSNANRVLESFKDTIGLNPNQIKYSDRLQIEGSIDYKKLMEDAEKEQGYIYKD